MAGFADLGPLNDVLSRRASRRSTPPVWTRELRGDPDDRDHRTRPTRADRVRPVLYPPASARRSGTAGRRSWRWTASISRSRPASSSACSGRRAAARPRCSTWSRTWTSRPRADRARASSRPAVVFQEAALMPWLTARRERRAAAADGRRTEAAAARERRPSCWSWSGSRDWATSGRTSCPAACGSGWRWPGRSPPRQHRRRREGRRLLLMDEPFSALDAITRDVLQGELLRIWRATGTAILFVTHDVREAVRLGQRVVLLSSRPGRVVREWDVGRTDRERAARRDQRRTATR